MVPGCARYSFVTEDPAEWLVCDSATVSRTLYPALFAAIGTKFGSGDGSTTFQLPPGPEAEPYLWIKT